MLQGATVVVDPVETDAWDWLVRLPRAVGAELQRDRPAVVVSSPAFDTSRVRIIVPLTTWQDDFAERFNKFLIPATNRNGLQADSTADFLQVRSVSTERLMRRVGLLRADEVEEIVAGIAIAVDYRP